MSNLAQNDPRQSVILNEAATHETSYRSVPRSLSQADRQSRGMGIETVGFALATGAWFCVGADVPVLRVNHTSGKIIVP